MCVCVRVWEEGWRGVRSGGGGGGNGVEKTDDEREESVKEKQKKEKQKRTHITSVHVAESCGEGREKD